MTSQSACCQPATVARQGATTSTASTAIAVEAGPMEGTQASVCCGSAADAATAGACCDPAAKREAIATGATCCG